MNSYVERPTKTISMHIGGVRQNEVRNTKNKEIVPVDFYTISNAPSVWKESGITAVSELLDMARARSMKESTTPRKPVSKDCLDFIILSLKNDVRVKHFKPAESTIKVCLWTIEDAIALYRQYFKLVEMSFMEDFDFDLEWDLWPGCLCSVPASRAAFEDDSQSIESSVLKSKPFTCSSGLGTPHSIELYKLQRDEFNRRVEYFSKMKPLFTKGDFKRMETALEGGSFDFVFKNCKELAVGSVSNVIVQEAIRHMNDEQICLLIKSFGYDIAPISATKYGAYTIQTLISAAVGKASQNLISCYFEGNGRFLILHEIGNYSIQKIIRFDMEMIYDFFVRDLDKIIGSSLGVKVFKRCIPFFLSKKDIILEKLASIETPENLEVCRAIIDVLNE